MDKITALMHEAKIEADENRSKDTRYFAASVVEAIEELQEQLAAALAACEKKNRGLDKLARLGNEPYLGNSVGNRIAAEFLAAKPDATVLRQRDEALIERCICVVYHNIVLTIDQKNKLADAIRELKSQL